jgi:hypothetical protein
VRVRHANREAAVVRRYTETATPPNPRSASDVWRPAMSLSLRNTHDLAIFRASGPRRKDDYLCRLVEVG